MVKSRPITLLVHKLRRDALSARREIGVDQAGFGDAIDFTRFEIENIDFVSLGARLGGDFVIDIDRAAPIVRHFDERIFFLELGKDPLDMIDGGGAVINHFAFALGSLDDLAFSLLLGKTAIIRQSLTGTLGVSRGRK